MRKNQKEGKMMPFSGLELCFHAEIRKKMTSGHFKVF